MEFQTYNGEEYDTLMKPIMIITKVIAIWPLERNRPASAMLFRVCHLAFLLFLLLTSCITVTADVIHHIDNLDELTDCALIACSFYLSVIRIIVCSFHQKDMLYITETIREDWISEDMHVIKEKSLFTFQFSKCFIITVFTTVISFSCMPILEILFLGVEERILPFRGYFFINQTVSPVYECLYVFNVISAIFAGGTIAGVTSLNLILVIHGAAKFAALQRRIEAIKSDDPNANRIVADCVKHHQNAITFADALERVINILALGQFVVSTGLVCFCGFQLTAMLENKGRLMKYSSFLNSAILELFMFSFSGNMLMDESNAISESAYNSDWIGSTFARSMQITMMRSKNPSRITAAKFYNMSLESFAQVLSTSFSYMMVLMAANE